MLSDKIKNADRVHRANNLIVQAVEHENNSEIISALLEVSQMISDIHKACVADFENVESDAKTVGISFE